VLVSTVLWGGSIAGRVCAFGALTQPWTDGPGEAARRGAGALERPAAWIKYGLLPASSPISSRRATLSVYRYRRAVLDVGLFGTTSMWIGLAVLLAATSSSETLYCRFLCPSAPCSA